jgi:hypothetical protein
MLDTMLWEKFRFVWALRNRRKVVTLATLPCNGGHMLRPGGVMRVVKAGADSQYGPYL